MTSSADHHGRRVADPLEPEWARVPNYPRAQMTIESRRLAPDQPPSRFAGRAWFGTALALAGAVLLFLGWYGVSGRASIGEQMPYLASGSIPGAALVVAAAVVLASESTQRATQRTDALVAELHTLLVVEEEEEEAAVEAVEAAPVATVVAVVETSREPDAVVALPAGEYYHRAGCALVADKSGVEPLDAAAIDRRRLSACPVCEPDRPTA